MKFKSNQKGARTWRAHDSKIETKPAIIARTPAKLKPLFGKAHAVDFYKENNLAKPAPKK